MQPRWRIFTAILFCYALPVIHAAVTGKTNRKTEADITEHLTGDYELDASAICNKLVKSDWDYSTDINNETKEEILKEVSLEEAEYHKQQWEEWFRDADYESFTSADVKRQVMFLSKLGTAALEEEKLKQYNDELNTMTNIYGAARICPFTNQNCDLAVEGMRLEPDMETVMAKSRNYKELQYVWEQWRDASGKPIKSNYVNYVALSNEAAQANDYADMGDMWRADYETENFQEEVQKLWEKVKPLYKRLHSYAKKKLHNIYKDEMPAGDFIPAHILGNMWAQSWENIYDILVPFKDAPSIDVTQSLIDQNYDQMKMFELADEFYTSMGLPSMAVSFGDLAIIEQPVQDIVCHASAWDFCDGEDFRVKMCTNIDEDDLITIHHELGHIQYFMQYKDKPITFRKGANPGFHEAIGDVIALSSSTPQHYVKIRLLEELEESKENDINALMKLALSKVAFLPFAMVIDSWRWEVFSGDTTEDKWNTRWWELRKEYQMIDSPSERDEQFFDPGAKYHVPGNSQYINYFIAHILQFQMHRALCIAAGEFDPKNPNDKPLYKCDFYGSTTAGKVLKDALALGGSIHWSEVLKQMTGESTLSGQALLDYFEPLNQYFIDQEPDEPVDQTIPIVVGSILGALVVAALVTYFVKRSKASKNEEV